MVDKGRQVVNEVAYNVKQEVTREVGVDPGREADKVVEEVAKLKVAKPELSRASATVVLPGSSPG